jgi:hypothetical protein
LLGISAVAAQEFTTIDLTRVTNDKRGHVTAAPTGRALFKGVPFDLPSPPRAIMTEGPFVKTTTSFSVNAKVQRPTCVYILLSGAYVKKEFAGKKVGVVRLRFADGSDQSNPIVAWETIRETWAYNDEIREAKPTVNPRLINVYSEPQMRGARPATGFLDMLVIDLGQTKVGTTLSGLNIEDTSTETVGDIAPSLVISAITIGSLPETAPPANASASEPREHSTPALAPPIPPPYPSRTREGRPPRIFSPDDSFGLFWQ